MLPGCIGSIAPVARKTSGGSGAVERGSGNPQVDADAVLASDIDAAQERD